MFSLFNLCFILSFCFLTSTKSDFVDLPVSQLCLGCICGIISDCNTRIQCEGDACGPFRFNLEYWIEAGNLTINNYSPTSYDSFLRCSKEFICSVHTVQEYMKKHKKDCNGDGKINCEDFVAIHLFGPDKCTGNWSEVYKHRFDLCKRRRFN
ncbi:hypothetical protein RI129_004359 [Pyrocoelia pectoralis]|uniref:lysozyme n=1 Tax=Pyrocoelia pectoralis TaxID=417401 RepID=A0AAN7VC69_9COLE